MKKKKECLTSAVTKYPAELKSNLRFGKTHLFHFKGKRKKMLWFMMLLEVKNRN